MLKLTKTGIGLLTKQYRSVLRKCLIANLCILYPLTSDAQYAMLYGDNTFIGNQYIANSSDAGKVILRTNIGGGVVALTSTDGAYAGDIFVGGAGGRFDLYNTSTNKRRVSLFGETGELQLLNSSGIVKTILSDSSFQLNGSSHATGIDFAAEVTAGTTNASHLATTGAVNQLLNYYYTFRVDEISEPAEFSLFLNNEKLSNVFEA